MTKSQITSVTGGNLTLASGDVYKFVDVEGENGYFIYEG